MLGILEYEYEPKVVVNRFFETRDDGLVHVIYWEFATSGNYLWSKFFWKDESWKSFGFWWPWEPFSCAIKYMFEAPLSNIVDGRNPAQSWM